MWLSATSISSQYGENLSDRGPKLCGDDAIHNGLDDDVAHDDPDHSDLYHDPVPTLVSEETPK
jgi:hypothetical protein